MMEVTGKFYEAIAQLREEFKHRLASAIYSVVRFSFISVSSANGENCAVEGQVPGTDESYQSEDDVRIMSTWGVRSVPPKGVHALICRAGGGATQGVVVACESPRFGPSDLKDGESALYNKVTGMVVRLNNDGTIDITSQSGQDIRLGASASDPVVTKKDLGALYFAINAAAIVASDGGASLKTTLLTGLQAAGWVTAAGITQCGSSNVKALR